MQNTHAKRILHLNLQTIRKWRGTDRMILSLEHFEANKTIMEHQASIADEYESMLPKPTPIS